jgi:SAM-dependent methyltransferase
MSQKVSRAELEPLFGERLIEFLCDWGILVEHNEGLAGSVDIHPCMDRFFLTDRAIGMQRDLQSVYHLGGDSYALAWLTPRTAFKKALDLATGSGVHAVLAAEHTKRVHGVDISQRALDFATFNAICNGVKHRVEFLISDVYEDLPDGQYDLVLSNLPWVPTPDEPMELYRSGGNDGEVLIRRMIEGLRERLEAGGWMSSYIEYPKYADDTYLERVKGWLGEGSWGIVLLNLKHFSNAAYIMPHVASHSDQDLSIEFAKWMASYREANIEGMGWAMLYITKLDSGPGWSTEVESDFPLTPQAWVGEWLQELVEAHSGPPPSDWKPCLHPEVELWRNQDGQKWKVEWPSRSLQATEVSSELGDMLGRISESGSFTPAEMKEIAEVRKLGIFQSDSRSPGTGPAE